MAMININGLKNVAKSVYTKISTLPEGARPSGTRVVNISDSSGAYVRLTIQSNGDVFVYNYTDINTGNIVQTFTYIK